VFHVERVVEEMPEKLYVYVASLGDAQGVLNHLSIPHSTIGFRHDSVKAFG
jgi:hypothetical protein